MEELRIAVDPQQVHDAVARGLDRAAGLRHFERQVEDTVQEMARALHASVYHELQPIIRNLIRTELAKPENVARIRAAVRSQLSDDQIDAQIRVAFGIAEENASA